MTQRRALLGWLAAACLPARAASDVAERRYAVLALIGDSLTVVAYRPSTGSHLDQNASTVLTLTDRTFDHAAVFAARKALRQVDPNVKAVLMEAADAGVYSEQSGLFNGQRLTPPAWLDEALIGAAATHLVLITKHRAPANLRAVFTRLGTGSLFGLGFYIDNALQTCRTDTNECARGFVASYAHLRVAFVDVASRAVLGERYIATGVAVSTAENVEKTDPWNAMTPEQKVTSLTNLIETEVPKSVAALLR